MIPQIRQSKLWNILGLRKIFQSCEDQFERFFEMKNNESVCNGWPGHLLKQGEDTAECPECSWPGSDLAGEDWLPLLPLPGLLLLLLFVVGGGEEMGGV